MVILLTGPEGAGKTTVGRLLAERFERGVHLEGDWFRRAIVRGRIDMTPEPGEDALAQLRLRYALAAAAAGRYAAAGFTVVWEDVVAGPLLAEVAHEPTIVLLPSEEAVAARRGERHAPWVYRLFAEETPRVGLWLDTSGQTPAETVDAVLARLPSGA